MLIVVLVWVLSSMERDLSALMSVKCFKCLLFCVGKVWQVPVCQGNDSRLVGNGEETTSANGTGDDRRDRLICAGSVSRPMCD